MTFLKSFQSEWLKKKRSLASWLVLVGALLTPTLVLIARLNNPARVSEFNVSADFWSRHWNQSWESMALFLLPGGIILVTGLIAQIEYKNNAWKQLHATPQALTTIFAAKLLVILIMLGQVFVLFNLGVYLSAVLPSTIFTDVSAPSAALPFLNFRNTNVNFFVDCLPIVALQYLLSLHFKNFLIPVGAGLAIWFLGIGLLPWEYSYLFPYNHVAISYLMATNQFGGRQIPIVAEYLALIYFVFFIAAGWILYVTKEEKG